MINEYWLLLVLLVYSVLVPYVVLQYRYCRHFTAVVIILIESVTLVAGGIKSLEVTFNGHLSTL